MKQAKIHKLLGLYWAIGNVWGNCFAPALVLETHKRSKPTLYQGRWCYAARLVLILRTKSHLETRVYWRGGLRVDWNSEHLARRFGTPVEAPHGTCYFWKGHADI